MASVTGSRLAFFSSTVTADKVNVVLTTDGSDVAGKAIVGDFNIEVFTATAGPLAGGFQASALVTGAQSLTNNAITAGSLSSTEQLLDGSFTLVDLTGSESIQIVGSNGSSDVVVGWVPFYHDLGIVGDVLVPLLSGVMSVAISTRLSWGDLFGPLAQSLAIDALNEPISRFAPLIPFFIVVLVMVFHPRGLMGRREL